ncbi:MAG: MFS transporter [Desulfovibrio sp.]|nr:MFS transporter [Desulfovibrio sp.]
MPPHSHTHMKSVYRTYAGLLLVSVCVYCLMYAPQPMFNSISAEFGTDKSQTAMTVGVFMLCLAVAPLFAGMLLSRIGQRAVLLGACGALALSSAALWFVPGFAELMALRSLQAVFVPFALTAVMSSIAQLFRHMALGRALAGYVTSNLVGSMLGRLGGGWCAELFGWRPTLAGIGLLFVAAVLMLLDAPKSSGEGHAHRAPNFRDAAAIFRTPCVPSLLFVEGCGFFVFAAVGSLIPFRMLELGQGDSESLIGLMYLGYMVGFFASSSLGVLKRLFGTTTRLIIAGSLLYMLSAASMAAPNLWVLFYGIFFMTFGEFLVHVNIPGIVNRLTERHDRGMVNGLFLSCYYFGGVLGTLVPSLAYTRFGWTAAYGTMQAILCMAFLVLLALRRRLPETR